MFKKIQILIYINSTLYSKPDETQQIKKKIKSNHISKHASNLILNEEQQNINQSMLMFTYIYQPKHKSKHVHI